MLAFADICGPKRYSYSTHRFNMVSIWDVYAQFYIFEDFFCAYEKYFMNFHTQLFYVSLIRNSETGPSPTTNKHLLTCSD